MGIEFMPVRPYWEDDDTETAENRENERRMKAVRREIGVLRRQIQETAAWLARNGQLDSDPELREKHLVENVPGGGGIEFVPPRAPEPYEDD